MSRLVKDASRVAGNLRAHSGGKPKCPLCGGTLLYQGLTDAECSGPGCSNNRAGAASSVHVPGTLAWARALRAAGMPGNCFSVRANVGLSSAAGPWIKADPADAVYNDVPAHWQEWRLSVI